MYVKENHNNNKCWGGNAVKSGHGSGELRDNFKRKNGCYQAY